jgi:glutathione S-transferase
MSLILYYASGACSMAPHIVLEEIGTPYDTVRIDLKAGQQNTPEFRAINPRGKVPVLKIGDEILTEGIAILFYLARGCPEQPLLPPTVLSGARCFEWLSFLEANLHTTQGEILHPEKHSTDPEDARAIRTKAKERQRENYRDVDRHIHGRFAVGDSFTIADAFLFVFYTWGRLGRMVDAAQTPTFFAWGEAMRTRPSIERVLKAEGVTF